MVFMEPSKEQSTRKLGPSCIHFYIFDIINTPIRIKNDHDFKYIPKP